MTTDVNACSPESREFYSCRSQELLRSSPGITSQSSPSAAPLPGDSPTQGSGSEHSSGSSPSNRPLAGRVRRGVPSPLNVSVLFVAQVEALLREAGPGGGAVAGVVKRICEDYEKSGTFTPRAVIQQALQEALRDSSPQAGLATQKKEVFRALLWDPRFGA